CCACPLAAVGQLRLSRILVRNTLPLGHLLCMLLRSAIQGVIPAQSRQSPLCALCIRSLKKILLGYRNRLRSHRRQHETEEQTSNQTKTHISSDPYFRKRPRRPSATKG